MERKFLSTPQTFQGVEPPPTMPPHNDHFSSLINKFQNPTVLDQSTSLLFDKTPRQSFFPSYLGHHDSMEAPSLHETMYGNHSSPAHPDSISPMYTFETPLKLACRTPKKYIKKKKYGNIDEVPDELWECVLCKAKSNMTPLKRRGEDGKRNLCNACYVRLRVRKERSERGSARPIMPSGFPSHNHNNKSTPSYTSTRKQKQVKQQPQQKPMIQQVDNQPHSTPPHLLYPQGHHTPQFSFHAPHHHQQLPYAVSPPARFLDSQQQEPQFTMTGLSAQFSTGGDMEDPMTLERILALASQKPIAFYKPVTEEPTHDHGDGADRYNQFEFEYSQQQQNLRYSYDKEIYGGTGYWESPADRGVSGENEYHLPDDRV